jgi:16S rRNA G966 N2-methylase RsmD
MERNIDEIKISNRHRKNLGDIEGLASSIEKIGLLHPIVIQPDNTLVAGERRLAACKLLGWKKIPVRVVNLDDIVRGEHDENVFRKDFTPSEAVAIGEALEPLERQAAKERQAQHGNTAPGRKSNTLENFSEVKNNRALDKVASAVGMSRPTYQKAKEIVRFAQTVQMPELIEVMDEKGVERALKQKRKIEIEKRRAEMAKAGAHVLPSERWRIWHGDIRTWNAPRKYDFIITDPPYPKEYLPLWETLAERANEWLTDGGLLIAMSGQSYFDGIMEMMSRHLDYYWTGCYLTPGQPTPMRQVNVNTTWKPLLIFTKRGGKYTGKIFGDVFVSDGNDKSLHKWGQSESGMFDIISKICLPGQWILDPFCGAATTGVAALRHGCLFHGLELEAENVEIGKARLYDIEKTG